MSLTIGTAARNAQLDALTALVNGGTLRIYTAGSGRPAGPGTAISDQTLLAELPLSNPAFGAAAAGVATANAITTDAAANATGTAAWYRVFASDGTTAVWDGKVGTANADLIMATVSLVADAAVSITSFTLTAPAGTAD